MRKRCQIYITGNVQRVGFRHHASLKAKAFDISGKAMYVDEGLFIEAEAEEKNLAQFIGWCHTGPDLFKIERIRIKELEPGYITGFEIKPAFV